MADKKSDEMIADLVDLQRRAKELFAEHNRVNQELLKVIEKINSLTGQKDRPAVSADTLERR